MKTSENAMMINGKKYVIEVFSTGGGFYSAEMNLENGMYFSIDSDDTKVLTLYRENENGEKYMPEDVMYSNHYTDLLATTREIYDNMLKALNER